MARPPRRPAPEKPMKDELVTLLRSFLGRLESLRDSL